MINESLFRIFVLGVTQSKTDFGVIMESDSANTIKVVYSILIYYI